jgi:hypothetical protein
MASFRAWVEQHLTDAARKLESDMLAEDARLSGSGGLDLDDIAAVVDAERRLIPARVDAAVEYLRAAIAGDAKDL